MTLEFGRATRADLRAQFADAQAQWTPRPRAEPWRLTGVRIVSATVELKRAVIRDRVPESMGVTRPGLGRLVALSAASSPVGAFDLAMLVLPTRTGGVMRDWVVDAVGTDAVAGSTDLGVCVRPGEVTVRASGGDVQVSVADSSGTLGTLAMTTTDIDPGLVRIDPLVVPVVTTDGTRIDTFAVESDDPLTAVDHSFRLSANDTGGDWSTFLGSPWLVTSLTSVADSALITAPVESELPEVHDIVTVRYA